MQHEDWIGSAEQLLKANWPSALEDLQQLISIESVRSDPTPGAPFGSGPAQALSYMLRRGRDMGFAVQNHGGYVGTADFGPEEPGLDILNHVDVVPGGNGWKITQPFAPLLVPPRLYGRGAADNKGPAISVLYALFAVKESGARLRRRVRLIWGCGEETGAQDIKMYYRTQSPAPWTVTPDAAFPVICSEKGRLECRFFGETDQNGLVKSLSGGSAANAVPDRAEAVVNAKIETVQAAVKTVEGAQCSVSGADGQCRIVVQGKAAHAAAPQKGTNALSVLLQVIAACPGAPRWAEALAELFPPKGYSRSVGDDQNVTASLSAMTVEQGTFTGLCEERFPPCAKAEAEKDRLLKSLERIGCQTEVLSFSQAHCVQSDSPFVQTLLDCYRDAGGIDGCARAIAGNTYAHGIPGAVAFGFANPAVPTGTHGADEYVDLDQLMFGARVYIRTILELCC